MHCSCVINAERFVNKYLNPSVSLKVLDVGSFNVNGSLRPLFTYNGCICAVCAKVEVATNPLGSCCGKSMLLNQVCDGVKWRPLQIKSIGPNWQYFGMDLRASCEAYGKDITTNPHLKKFNVDILMDDPYKFPLGDNSFDVIVSTSCLEHDSLFWLTFNEMVRVVRPGGYIYINAPSSGPYHGYPDDCWRFQKDAYKALSTWNPGAVLLESYIDTDIPNNGGWMDNVGIFRVG